MKQNYFYVITLICVIIVLVVVMFIPTTSGPQVDPIVTPTVTPTATPTITPTNSVPVAFTSLYVKTAASFSSMLSPSVNIITDGIGLKKYTSMYNDEHLKTNLVEFDEIYFSEKALIIIAIQETSSSNINNVVKVLKIDDKVVLCQIERHIAVVGTCDMAMNYIIIQVDNEDIDNVETAIVV